MKRMLFVALCVVLFVLPCLARINADGSVSVRGYYRANGTYVHSYTRSAPDSVKWNNFGSSSSDGYNYFPKYRDHDNDGIPNYLDEDDNNDGVSDDGWGF